MDNLTTAMINYTNRHNFICEVSKNGEVSENARVQFIIRQNYYIDIFVEGEFIRTSVDEVGALATAKALV